jgi:hypothetical protein
MVRSARGQRLLNVKPASSLRNSRPFLSGWKDLLKQNCFKART